jgi:hypothetical protein
MDRLPQGAALAAAVLTAVTLAACGGDSSAPVAGPAGTPPNVVVQTVDGVSTPASVSVVTAKNAQ